MFDPNQFLDKEITSANDTKIIPCPVGDHEMTITKLKPRAWAKKDDPTVNGVALDVFCEVDNPDVRNICKRDEVIVKHGIMLDMDETGQELATGPGKNVGLGRLREAVGLNNDNEAFSFNMLIGRRLLGKVSHRLEGEDIFAEVKTVAKL